MKVKFLPQNVEISISEEQTIMELAHKNNIGIRSVCNGRASCGACVVHVAEGEENLLPPTQKEQSVVGSGFFLDQKRLSCQLKCFGDVTVDTGNVESQFIENSAVDGVCLVEEEMKEEK